MFILEKQIIIIVNILLEADALLPTPRDFECREGDRTTPALAAINNDLPNFVIYDYFYIYYRSFSHKIDANSNSCR